MPRFNRERASIILVDALYSDDELAAEKHGITARTIRNYRERLDSDQELSALFHSKRREREKSWADDMPAAISSGVEYLRKVSEGLKPEETSPEMVHAIAGAVKVLSEVRMTKDVLDARLARQSRTDDQ